MDLEWDDDENGIDIDEVDESKCEGDDKIEESRNASPNSANEEQINAMNYELKEDVYVEHPKRYEKKDSEHKVYKVQKALYGLKQAPQSWFSRIEAHFINEGFQSDDELMMSEYKISMMREFDMTDLERMRCFLGIEVLQKSDGVYI
ncbi:Retrovirus-related Pol polyprotein from transposon TNT 1-94 [Abeliophyllum distichum]|uniref:Retrovirus-related Pol polyprotein from transposon TNT 1-94 n=1 Tax=Abeliophyllum distichum TaxID=126358 RepID=A0ABD1QUQ5_9LAMI